VERWIEGDRNARVRLHNAKWSAHKAWLRSVKWTVWLAIALATGGAWVFYFTDAPALLGNLLNGTAHPAAYITIAILTATTFVFGGFMREQVCIYMCPWPRIQSAMMDPDTLTVAYRDWRGEPRGKGKRTDPNVPNTHVPDLAQALHAGTDPVATKGDCIDCMACVNVCPMGIDIRDGQQMECITCALCIDACDDVMDRIGKPRGLIDYMALTDEPRERSGLPPRPIWQHILRPRTIVYTLLWSAIGVGLVYALFIRSPIELTVSPVRNPTYVVQSDGAIRNIYDVRLRNKSLSEAEFRLSLTADTVLRIDLEGNADRDVIVTVPADTSLTQRVYVTARASDPAATAHDTALRFWVEDASTGDRASQATTFNGRVQ
jgi:cytochrome c oxidase accessory protein FixG